MKNPHYPLFMTADIFFTLLVVFIIIIIVADYRENHPEDE
jgi:hypothetical protein